MKALRSALLGREAFLWYVLTGLAFYVSAAFGNYDQKPHMPIHIQQGNIQGSPVVMVIQEGRFHCKDGEHRALLFGANGPFWIGCAKREGDKYAVRFEDGDEYKVPAPKEV